MSRVSAEFVEHARRGLTPWWAYVLTPILAMLLWVTVIVAAYIPAFIARLVPADFQTYAADPSHPVFFYGFTGVIFALLLLAFVVAARLVHGKRFGDIVGAWRWKQFAAGAGLWIGVCIVSALIDYAAHPSGFRLTLGPPTLGLAAVAIPALAAQTFCEEFIFRGYATQGLYLATKRPLVAALVSGLIFASMHILNGWPQAASALVFGIVTALIFMRTGNLAFTYGLHLVNNLFGGIVVVSASDVLHGSPGVFTQATPGLIWLDVAASIAAFALAWFVAARLMSRARPDAAL
ncbi:MAG TPA: type II CAAX endopeptidase family protein [Caulobacteraceae bacterium]